MSRSWLRALGYFPIYIILIGLAAGMWSRPLLLTGCYAVLGGVMLLRWHSRSDVGFFFLAGVLGPLGEIIGVRFGAWHYTLPWIDIPVWLPLGWAVAGLYLKKTTEVLAGGMEKRS